MAALGSKVKRISLVGCLHYQQACAKMVNDDDFESKMSLKPEPENEFDSKAICILYDGAVVGHVSKATQLEADRLMSGSPLQWSLSEARFATEPFAEGKAVLRWAEFDVRPVE